jgi:hypothetical protein
MMLGYALGVTANQYDGTGRNTFCIDPDSTWVIAE